MNNELSDEVKTFIVQALAMYQRPAQVIAAVKAGFEISVSKQQIQFYDPTKGAASKRLSERWVNLFNETRSRFDAEVATIPITKQAYRFAMLQRMAERNETRNPQLAAELLKQVAQDMGSVFTNTKNIKVDDPARQLADLLGLGVDELPDLGSRVNPEDTVH
jgi:hypothetical protein